MRNLRQTITRQTYNKTVTDYFTTNLQQNCDRLLWKICDEIFYNKLTTDLQHIYDRLTTDSDRLLYRQWQTIVKDMWWNILRQTYDRLLYRQWPTIVTDYCERYVVKYFTTDLQQTILQHIYDRLTANYCDRLLWKICDEIFYNRLVTDLLIVKMQK